MTKTPIPPSLDDLSFEAAMLKLEAIVRGLESGSADLDKAIGDYQMGNALKEHCLSKLAEAKLKVEQIQARADGTMAITSFATVNNTND